MEPPAQEPRQPARVSEEERSAAQQLRAQSQAWKSRDDGWTLWPASDDPANAEMTLTPEELQLIEAQLGHSPSQSEPDAQPTRAEAPDAEAFTPSHTLAEDAALVTETKPAHRPERERPVQGAWEPETPAPRKAPSSDFDLLGSLRQPIELPQPPAESEPHRKPVIGRLLGHRAPADDTPPKAAPRAPKPARAPRQKSTAPTTPWPAATRWARSPDRAPRLVVRHGCRRRRERRAGRRRPARGAGAHRGRGRAGESYPCGLRADRLRHARARSRSPNRSAPPSRSPNSSPTPERAAPAQQPLFTMPPVSTDRWAATKPDMPSAPRRGRPRSTGQEAWPPDAAWWPPQASPAAPWPVPHADVPASVVAAARAERAEMPESPLVAALWAESAQRVLDRGTVRVCHSCALPVSTQARYCRRCGTRQG